jgi:succinate dehydrogenase hydrophobic anchor subunit
MSGQPQRMGRYLGRPDAAYPGFVPGAADHRPVRPTDGRSRAGRLWLLQALSGAALLVFLGIHLVAQHLLAPGGLRDYASVVVYLHNPVALVAEIGLVAAVIVHAVIGLRAALLEIAGSRMIRRISIVLVAAGAVAFVYAMWLTFALTSTRGGA